MPVAKRALLSKLSLPKLIILGAAGLAVVIIVLSMLGMVARQFGIGPHSGVSFGGDGDMAMMEESVASRAYPGMMPPMADYYAGNDAQAYEATDYDASIRTRSLARACDSIDTLKTNGAVVFMRAERNDQNCFYSFKVEKERVEGVVEHIDALSPDTFTKRTETIAKTVRDYSGELSALEERMVSLTASLESAEEAYDELVAFAVENGDADALARAIQNKIAFIDRLTQEKLALEHERERMTRAKDDELDRLVYTYFTVSVVEDRIVDLRGMAETWKQSLKDMVAMVNHVLMGVTIGLIGYLFLLAQFALYGFILLVIAKFGWRLVRRVWEW